MSSSTRRHPNTATTNARHHRSCPLRAAPSSWIGSLPPIHELAEQGKGVIFISSEFPELVGTCNRVLVMREGRLVGEFEGDEVTESALVERCYAA